MDRSHELENLRRSIVMLPPKSPALDREKAIALLSELEESDERLKRLRDGVAKLLEDDEST